LFDWDDHEMRTCKEGNKLDQNPIRWNANNSAVWPEDLTQQDLIRQMLDMDRGQRGEPGIFSRENAVKTKPARRKRARFGTNPCGEIILRPYQVCNLSIAVAREDDTEESLMEKVEVASIIGTIQSMAEHFPGLREEWVRNQQEERLLGVDILGAISSELARDADVERRLKAHAIATNEKYAKILGINPSASVTCNKPGGNSAQTLGTSSGIHAWKAPYYIRNIRVAASSPVCRALKDCNVPMNPENGQTEETATTWVIPFPVKAPDGAIVDADMTAIDQLENWLKFKLNWVEHNPSCTITYSEDELLDVIKWVWQHRDLIGGLSFLPRLNPAYDQLPYQEITQIEYLAAIEAFPKIDFSKIYRYEFQDMTTATSELACFAGSCDV
jgi:ribonucleoside-triphosphate reductase